MIVIPKALDITNIAFGKLTAIRRAPNRGRKSYWVCRCDCENHTELEVQTGHLTSGAITSCGCARINMLVDDGIARLAVICGNWPLVKSYCPSMLTETLRRASVLMAFA